MYDDARTYSPSKYGLKCRLVHLKKLLFRFVNISGWALAL